MPLNTTTFTQHSLMRIALVMAFIQFTNALEYMAFTPVFAFMAGTFSVPVSFAGYVSGMYTLAAVISGIAAYYWIERVNQKRFLFSNMLLLAVLTALCTIASRIEILLALRFCAGLVGGTTMGVGMSIVINCTPPNLRGRILATVIAAFSMVSIVGMPAVLFLCTHAGWPAALWLIAALCLLSLPLIVFIVPREAERSCVPAPLPVDGQTLAFASCTALVQFSPMLIIPILTPLLTDTLGAQKSLLPLLYFAGGVAGYLSTKVSGLLFSRVSALTLAAVSTLLLLVSLLIPALGAQHPLLFIVFFLAASYSRLVCASAVVVAYPRDEQRASFTSLQTALMYLITTLAFFLSSLLLPDEILTAHAINRLLLVSAVTTGGFPVMVLMLQKRLAKRSALPG